MKTYRFFFVCVSGEIAILNFGSDIGRILFSAGRIGILN